MKLILVGPVRVVPSPTTAREYIVARRDGRSHVHVMVPTATGDKARQIATDCGAAWLYLEAVLSVSTAVATRV
jgi:hypothetical protein